MYRLCGTTAHLTVISPPYCELGCPYHMYWTRPARRARKFLYKVLLKHQSCSHPHGCDLGYYQYCSLHLVSELPVAWSCLLPVLPMRMACSWWFAACTPQSVLNREQVYTVDGIPDHRPGHGCRKHLKRFLIQGEGMAQSMTPGSLTCA